MKSAIRLWWLDVLESADGKEVCPITDHTHLDDEMWDLLSLYLDCISASELVLKWVKTFRDVGIG